MASAIDIGSHITSGGSEYVVKKLLKVGGFGQAFLADQIKPSAREVVIKVPKPHIITDPIWSKRFEREARILSNIRHANVVAVIAFWQFRDAVGKLENMALVQELVVGAEDLRTYLRKKKDCAASAFLQTLYALRAFHNAVSPAVIHRDMSPDNILVSSDGIVKVIDFGISKEDPRSTAKLTMVGQWFGTQGCMSPEQVVDSESVDHRTDLFAVGRSFAAALQGRDPLHADPAGLPEPWKTLCMRLSMHDAKDRYQTADEALAHAMELFAAAKLPITEFAAHTKEHVGRDLISHWPLLCKQYFESASKLNQRDLEDAARIRFDALHHASLDAAALFERFEGSDAIKAFDDGAAEFEHGDALCSLYEKLYPRLSADQKVRCFKRIAENAKTLHRYYMMDGVRRIYASEKDDSIRKKLFAELEKVDANGVIESRGVLPERKSAH